MLSEQSDRAWLWMAVLIYYLCNNAVVSCQLFFVLAQLINFVFSHLFRKPHITDN